MKKVKEFWIGHKGYLLCCLMFMLFYMSHGCYYPYIGLYYKEIGMDNQQIGIVTALGPFLAMLVQTMWGRTADRAGRRLILGVTLVLSAVVMLMFYIDRSFWFTLLVAGLYVVVSTASLPLTDTIALDYCSVTRQRFAPIRLCGTIGFGVMPLFVGGLMGKNITNIFPLYALFCLLAAAVCAFVPKAQSLPEEKESRKTKGALKGMLRDPVILFVLTINFAVSFCMSMTNFMTVYASDMGMSTELTGLLNTISAGCEIPFFLVIDRVLRKRKRENVMLVTLIFTFLRMSFAYSAGFFPAQGFLFLGLSQSLHSVSYIMMYYCSAQLIHNHVNDDVRATAQTLVAMVSSGMSRAVGSVIAGAVGDAFGLQNAYLVFSLLVIVFAAPVLLFYRRMRRSMNAKTQLQA